MASTIAAVTTGTGGVVTTADASGNLNLLAGTTTVVALTTAGAAVSGTLSNTTGATFATSSGSVGVGTGSPSYKLDVNGTLGVTGVATFTASPVISAITNTGTITLPTKTGTLALNTVTTQVFTAGGTYTRPTGLVYALVYIKAGGASGASSTTGGYGASGGEGEEGWGLFTAATIGSSQTVTIGAGGAAVTNNTSADGNAGGTTSFGALITAAGSPGGTRGTYGGAPGAGGSGGTGGIYHMRGEPGIAGSDTGGNTASYNSGGGKGGGSFAAAAGANTGGGGGGGGQGNNSGAGGTGICVVYEYY